MSVFLSKNYINKLDNYQVQSAIDTIRKSFQLYLEKNLNLKRVSAPLFVVQNTGLNDDLSGVERSVTFDIEDLELNCEVVHSLAKWKRLALKKYNFHMHKGLWTDMNAIRRCEKLDNYHSVYVDQWDWEKIIEDSDRNLDYLKHTVQSIVDSICQSLNDLKQKFSVVDTEISNEVYFITSQQLLNMYPKLDSKERENEICRKYKTVFIFQIGDKLSDGLPHDMRAPDYDDWSLNGDLLFYHKQLDRALEISSMGIRVNPKSLLIQLEKSNKLERKTLMYHSMLLNNELPLTIGGGIGQSRLCMLLLGCCHIGEVQSSVWSKEDIEICNKNGINIL